MHIACINQLLEANMRHIIGKVSILLFGFKCLAWLLVAATSLIFTKQSSKNVMELAQKDDCPYNANDGESENIRAIRYG